KDARFVSTELKEKWPATQRRVINSVVRSSAAPRLVELSHPVVEAGVFETSTGVALMLGNFTYEPIAHLEIGLPVAQAPKQVRSVEKGPLRFTVERVPQRLGKPSYGKVVRCSVALGINDVLLFE